MIPYAAPLKDTTFVLNSLIGIKNLQALPGYEDVDADTIDDVLVAGAKLAIEVFSPLNRVGDEQGLKLIDGNVIMPPGFKEAYQSFVAGEWNNASVSPDIGGQGLPFVVGMVVHEMLQGANIGLALPTLLNQGGIEAVNAHASEEIKEKFLSKIVSGEWTCTMNLTEPQAGSDVGEVKCRAKPEGDHYLIKGTKIFISAGDHDMADNIVHLVLARLPDAPPGTKGLSLFVVPKIMVNDDGALGDRNDINVGKIEHKLGQHAAPTCVMNYGDNGGAVGYLVGEPGGGMKAMFTMMNNARIGVGYQGLAMMHASYVQALEYAKTRLQGYGADRTQQVPIIEHADVRRMLLSMKARAEAGRAMAMLCAFNVDVSKHSADEAQAKEAKAFVELMTPIVKATLTDWSTEVTSTGVQIHGGVGYIEETGAAQFMRDARITPIYEGTNGIQAADFMRKTTVSHVSAFDNILKEVERLSSELDDLVEDNAYESSFANMASGLSDAVEAMRKAGNWLVERGTPEERAASATAYLKLAGDVMGGYYLCKSAIVAHQQLTTGATDPEFLESKIITADHYASHVLSQSPGLAITIREGADSTLLMKPGMF